MLFRFLKKRRRAKVRLRATPQSWVKLIKENCPFYEQLSEQDREKLHAHLNVFLDEKSFEGCGGLLMTQEVRLTIAAQACLLILHRESDYYSRLKSIIVYPTTFNAQVKKHDGHLVTEEDSARLGESWETGSIVLAWDSVKRGGQNHLDGLNVVYHEFAHQLDQVNGAADGLPQLAQELSFFDKSNRERLESWAKIMKREYEELCDDSESGRKTLLDDYGTTNPAEFFAVTTEAFFERGPMMKKKHPELYEQFSTYFQQDTASWK